MTKPVTRDELQQRWRDALRSGQYPQGRHDLKSAEGKYCCLGVLCELIPQISQELEGTSWIFKSPTGESEISVLPGNSHTIVGLHGASGEADHLPNLTDLNDGGTPFMIIAELLEDQDSPYWDPDANPTEVVFYEEVSE